VRGTGAAAAPLRTPQVAAAAAAAPRSASTSTAVFPEGVHEVFAGGEEEDYSVGATRGPSSQTGRGLCVNYIFVYIKVCERMYIGSRERFRVSFLD